MSLSTGFAEEAGEEDGDVDPYLLASSEVGWLQPSMVFFSFGFFCVNRILSVDSMFSYARVSCDYFPVWES